MSPDGDRSGQYGIEQLARLAGVSVRTIRYYIGEQLLPRPLGRGPGRHYDDRHLMRLIAVRSLQEQGLELDRIQRLLQTGGGSDPRVMQALSEYRAALADAGSSPGAPIPARPSEAARSAWTRVELAPGLELHVSAEHRLPSPRRLRTLAAQCAAQFGIAAKIHPD